MAIDDEFSRDFRKLLKKIPKDFTLPEFQFLFRQVIFSMSMNIFDRFANDAVGPDPFSVPMIEEGTGKPPPALAATGGGSVGGHPNVVLLATFALAMTPCCDPKKKKIKKHKG